MSSEILSIRPASLADVATVAAFDKTDDKAFFKQKTNDAFYDVLIAQQSVLLAYLGDKPVGSMRWDFIWPERLPLLSWLYVLPEHRGSAVAERLFFAALTSIQKQGYDYLLVSACDARLDIINKLKSEGLMQAGELTFPDGSREVFFWIHLPFKRKQKT